jgi:hypothetical protein
MIRTLTPATDSPGRISRIQLRRNDSAALDTTPRSVSLHHRRKHVNAGGEVNESL